MRGILTILAALFIVSGANAQFGISARLQNNSNKTWTTTFETNADTTLNLFNRSYEFGVNYWFKLKNYRVEFLPEITYAFAEDSGLQGISDLISHKRTSYNFNMNVQLYPLDFFGDCDCPTFSKDGDFLAKGFYWVFSPGISRHTLSSTFDADSGRDQLEESITSIRVGLGAGLDIGVTNLITVSPFLMYSMNFSNAWPGQYEAYQLTLPENESNSNNINQWHLGVRLVFRPDYKKNNF